MANQRYEALLRVAETGSIKHAARDLGYSPAGLANLIKALERETGVVLLVRGYGSARLTAEGRDLLPWIRNVCNGERQLSSRVAELKGLESGTIRVASFPAVTACWFPGIAAAFRSLHPEIDLELASFRGEDDIEAAIWRGDVDCGFVAPPLERGLDAFPLHRDRPAIALPPDHPLAGAEHIPVQALAEEPYIRLQGQAPLDAERVLREGGIEPRIRFAVDDGYAAMRMVAAGLGFSVLPGLLIEDAPFDLAAASPLGETAQGIALAVHSMDAASAATRAFVNVALAWAKQRYGEEGRQA